MASSCKDFNRLVSEVEGIIGFDPVAPNTVQPADFKAALEEVKEDMRLERKREGKKALREIVECIKTVVKAREDMEKTCDRKLQELKDLVEQVRDYMGDDGETAQPSKP